MLLRIVPYTKEWVPAVLRFNARMAASGSAHGQPGTHENHQFPSTAGQGVFEERFLVVDGDEVRGGYTLKQHDAVIGQTRERIAFLRLPVSEGRVDARYAMAGVQILMDAMRRHPMLFCFGSLGGADSPLPKMLERMKWQICQFHYFYRVIRPSRFLWNLEPPGPPVLKVATRAAALFGALPLAIAMGHRILSRHGDPDAATRITEVSEFDDGIDHVWERAASELAVGCVRTAAVLRILYPADIKRFRRFVVYQAAHPIGWAVVLYPHPTLGVARAANIVDACAVPGAASVTLQLVTKAMRARGAEVIGALFTHHEWRSALRGLGYLELPSKIRFAAAPALTERIGGYDAKTCRWFFARADGDSFKNQIDRWRESGDT